MLDNFKFKKWHFVLIISVLAALMIVLVLLSTNTKTHDGDEYVTFIKYFAGVDNIKLFWIHSSIYPLLGSLLVKAYPSIKAVQMLGIAILFLTGALICGFTRSKKAVMLWAFSPVVWLLGGSIYPAMLGALLFFAAYILLKKYEGGRGRHMLLLAGLMLGLSNAVTETSWPYSLFFILIFFYGKQFKDVLQFAVPAIIGFAAKLIVDYFIFGYAHFSLLRFLGANFVVFIGGHTENIIYRLSPLNIVVVLFGISPLLFLAYKGYKKGLKAESIFIAVSLFFMLFIYTTGLPHHFFSIVPIAVVLLSKTLSGKQAAISALLSIPLIIYLSMPGISSAWTSSMQSDIAQMQNEFNYDAVIADRNLELPLAANIWSSRPYVIWLDEYLASKTGTKVLKTYELSEEPRFNNFKIARLSFSYIANTAEQYPENLPFLTKINGEAPPLEGYALSKCYKGICVYEKQPSARD